jgi:hypothetical protein
MSFTAVTPSSTRQLGDFAGKIGGFASADSVHNMEKPTISGVDHSLNLRVFRTMLVTTAVAVTGSLFFAPWRVSTGLLIGGVLAIFSHRWLKNSAAAAIEMAAGGGIPRLRLAQFLLRYIVVAALVYSVVVLDVANLTALLAGLATFVVALMVEAVREFYFAITHREEMN